MYRVYDSKEKCWVRDDFFISPNGDMYVSDKRIFPKFSHKLVLVPEQRFIVQRKIGMDDRNGKPIFEGDICKITARNVIGVIAYIPQHASYYLLDEKNLKYYPLYEKLIVEQVEVIGNVCENNDLLPSK